MQRISNMLVSLNLCYFVLGLLLFSVDTGLCGEPSATGEIIVNVNRAIRNRELFQKWNYSVWKCSEEELQILSRHDDDTVSISSAFELFVVRPAQDRARKVKETRSTRNNNVRSIRKHRNRRIINRPIDRGDAARFVGFCEGRLRILLPPWYLTVLESGSVRDFRSMTGFVRPNTAKDLIVKRELKNVKKTVNRKDTGNSVPDFPILNNPPNVLAVASDNVILHGKSANLNIPISFLNNDKMSEKGIAFTNDDRRFWVSIYDRDVLSRGQSLMYFYEDDVHWNSSVWGGIYPDIYRLPSGYQLVSVIRHEILVYVVGAGTYGVYIEGFDSASGEVVMRFLSSVTPDVEKQSSD